MVILVIVPSKIPRKSQAFRYELSVLSRDSKM